MEFLFLKQLYKNYRSNGGEKNYSEFINYLNLIDFVTLEKKESSGMLDAFVQGIKQASKNILNAYDESEKDK